MPRCQRAAKRPSTGCTGFVNRLVLWAIRACMHNTCVVALQIRDVPEDVRDALVAQAKARGQSLQSYLLELVETQARRLRNTEILGRFAGRSDGSRVLSGETSAELAEQRQQSGAARHIT
jgi:antitoxin FitA